MRIGDISETIISWYNNPKTRRRTMFLLGKSGIGKSASVMQAAEALGIGVYDIRLSTSDPTNFGLLMPVDGVLVRQKPEFIEYMEQHPLGGILFLDEITSAPPAVQAPAYQLTNDRIVNGFAVPDTWIIVAAGNELSDRGITYTMAAPLLNRMVELKVETVLDDVLEYGAAQGLDPRVMSFLKNRADLLHRFRKEDHGQQFPTPRSWFTVSNILELNQPAQRRVELICGAVGQEAGTTFEQWLRVWETMPDIDAILEDPDSVEVPTSLDVQHCVTMGLSARMNKKNFDRAWAYLKKLPAEFGTLSVKLAYTRDHTIASAPGFSDWTTTHLDLFKRT